MARWLSASISMLAIGGTPLQSPIGRGAACCSQSVPVPSKVHFMLVMLFMHRVGKGYNLAELRGAGISAGQPLS